MMRIALAKEVDRAAIDGLALGLGWRLVASSPPSAKRPREAVFATGTELITFVEDDDRPLLIVAGHDPEPVAAQIRRALPVLDAAEEPTKPDESSSLAPPEPPARPRLSERVLVRMHIADGVAKVVLSDLDSGLVFEIDPASYRALILADGTRDVDALALALSREELYRGEADLRQLLSELHEAGLLEDGLPIASPPAPVARPETPPERPLEVLPGYTLVCDGRGSCCRFYGSIAFGPEEALRARLVAGRMGLPLAERELFTPLRGAQLDDDGVRIVAQIDGRCAFLDDEGRCVIHRMEGAGAKPFPCRFYPATLTDDGISVRVSLGPECACIFESVGRSDGTPLVPPSARTLGDLPSTVAVMHVPDPVPLASHRTAPRDELARWSAALVRTLESSRLDAARLAWHLADVVEREGLALDALERACLDPPPVDGRIEPWLEALHRRANPAALTEASWRGATDLSRNVARWIALALERPREHREPTDSASENFYLRALAHGHRLAVEGRSLAHGLRDRATRLLTARAMAAVEPPPHASARYPLALLEAAMRNLGLNGYADALEF